MKELMGILSLIQAKNVILKVTSQNRDGLVKRLLSLCILVTKSKIRRHAIWVLKLKRPTARPPHGGMLRLRNLDHCIHSRSRHRCARVQVLSTVTTASTSFAANKPGISNLALILYIFSKEVFSKDVARHQNAVEVVNYISSLSPLVLLTLSFVFGLRTSLQMCGLDNQWRYMFQGVGSTSVPPIPYTLGGKQPR